MVIKMFLKPQKTGPASILAFTVYRFSRLQTFTELQLVSPDIYFKPSASCRGELSLQVLS